MDGEKKELIEKIKENAGLDTGELRLLNELCKEYEKNIDKIDKLEDTISNLEDKEEELVKSEEKFERMKEKIGDILFNSVECIVTHNINAKQYIDILEEDMEKIRKIVRN